VGTWSGALLLCGALSGCGGAAEVSVDFSGSNASPSPGAGLDTGAGTAKNGAAGLELVARSGQATLTVTVDPAPTMAGPIAVGERHLSVTYQLGSNAWSSDAGTVTFSSVSPYTVTFSRVAMLAAGPGSAGGFFVDGTATFR
jgi:hypothetical protein